MPLKPHLRGPVWHKADMREPPINVRYWHLSLVDVHTSAFGGKADMTFALHMSAFDPKRTLVPHSQYYFEPVRCCPW